MNTGSSHKIAYGITYEWLADNTILRVHIDSYERDSVDALAQFAIDVHKNHAPPYNFLYEVDNPKIVLTPYARRHLAQMADLYQNEPGRTAYVLPYRDINHAMRFFLMARKSQTRQREIFQNQAAALAWLQDA
ncbi:MAG: hypothetical protein ACLFTK_08140 [Anaerolineales bacterium]